MRDGRPSSVAQTPPGHGRLRTRSEFLAVAKGRRFHTTCLTVQGLRRGASEGLEPASPPGSSLVRFGLTVTKRVGHATERNRIRRRLRAVIAQTSTDLCDAPLDIVLVGRREALSAPFGQLVADLGRALPHVARPQSTSHRPPDSEAGARTRGRSTSGSPRGSASVPPRR